MPEVVRPRTTPVARSVNTSPALLFCTLYRTDASGYYRGMSTVASEASAIVGQNVSTLRVRAGMTQQQLADACDIARPRVAEIESGKFNPTVDTVQAVADALGVAVERLFKKPAKGRLAS